MRPHYIILAHHLPEIHAELVRSLSAPGTSIVTHVDAKADIEAFRQSLSCVRGHHFIDGLDRIRVSWGGWSQVDATLRAMTRLSDHVGPHDYVTLLSGDSYPLLHPSLIGNFFGEAFPLNFLSATKMPTPDGSKPLSRLSRYYLEGERDPGTVGYAKRAYNKFLAVPRSYRAKLGARVPFAGGQWWSITGEALHWILDEAARDTQFISLARHSRIPDEFFFQTLLCNSHFRSSIRRSLMFVDWTSPTPPRPASISSEHVMFLRVSRRSVHKDGTEGPVLFARKVQTPEMQSHIREKLWQLSDHGRAHSAWNSSDLRCDE